jgi:hypothetical protein
MKYLIYTIVLFLIGQSLIWFQTNGQFVWEWIKKNPFLVSLMGTPIAYIFIKASYFSNQYFNNLWAGRMIGFSTGIFTFTLLTWIFANEPVTTKTLLTLLLAFGIILIQLFL